MHRTPLALLAAALVAAPAVADQAQDVGASVRPVAGHPRTTFRVSFTARRDTGVHGVVQSAHTVDVMRVAGPRAGCGWSLSVPAGDVQAGQRVIVRLRPPGGGWCRGRYAGEIRFSTGPYCPPDKEQPCPMFPSTSRVVGRFSLRVARR